MSERSPAARQRSLVIEPAALDRMREHAEVVYPDEACGALVGRAAEQGTTRVLEVVAASNARTDERERRYLIGPDDVRESERRAEAAGLQVVGYYHSHPDHPAVPSDFDREHAWPWYIYLIVSVRKGRAESLGAWRLSDDRELFLPVPFESDDSMGASAAD